MDDKFIPEQIVTSFGSFEGNEHIVEAIAEKDSQRIWSRLAREGLKKEVGLKRLRRMYKASEIIKSPRQPRRHTTRCNTTNPCAPRRWDTS